MRRGEDPFGFRHDGETTTPLETAVGPVRPTSLCFNVSQHAPVGKPSEPALVEVEDESGTLFLLTPVECLRLARALLESAGVVVGEPGDPDHLDELRRLAADVRDSAGRLALAAGAARRGKPRIENLTGTEAGDYCIGTEETATVTPEHPMTTFSFAVSPAHEAVARGLVGAHATDPVVPSGGPALARPRAPRSRSALAAALHRIADTVAPAESCSAC